MAIHHYIPRFVLRNFSEDGKMVCRIEKTSAAQFYRVPIKSAAAIKNYHRADFPVSGDPDEIEKTMSERESVHAESIKSVIDGAEITGAVRRGIIDYISYAMVRPPKLQQEMGTVLEKRTKDSAQNKGFAQGFGPGKIFGPSPDGFKMPSGEVARTAYKAAQSPRIKSVYADADIRVLRAKNSSFILGDCPHVCYRPEWAKSPGGIILPYNSDIINVVLGATTALEISWRRPPRKKTRMNAPEVAEINRRSVIAADRWLFSLNEDESIKRIIRKNAGYSAGMELSQQETQWTVHSNPVMPPEFYS